MAGATDSLPDFDATSLADVAQSLPRPQLVEFLEDYLASAARHLERATSRLAANDIAGLAAEAHTLISITGSYGLPRASAIARQLEAACKAGQTDRLAPLADEFAAACRSGWAALRQRFLTF